MSLRRALVVTSLSLTACQSGPSPAAGVPEAVRAPEAAWALAIHGGAGTIDPNTPAAERAEYEAVLTRALALGRDRLAAGDSALAVCEAVVRLLEDDPHFNAGVGAVFNEQGQHELDASIMDGSTLRCGAVAGVRTVKNPIALARRVMTETRHVLLMGDGAEQFATQQGVERVPNEHFDTERRRKVLEQVLRERARTGAVAPRHPGDVPGSVVPASVVPASVVPASAGFGTVGCVARDRQGKLAAATSTGGLTGKRWGRVGDTPVIGAGTYADADVAVSCTGTGEEFMRHVVAHSVSARMRFGGESLGQATHALVFDTLRPDDGGLIAVDRQGHLAAPFNSSGMYRGLADANGRFDVKIFAD